MSIKKIEEKLKELSEKQKKISQELSLLSEEKRKLEAQALIVLSRYLIQNHADFIESVISSQDPDTNNYFYIKKKKIDLRDFIRALIENKKNQDKNHTKNVEK